MLNLINMLLILNLQYLCYLVINGKELSAKILYQEYNAYLDEEIFKFYNLKF